jgi:tetratricopeptide (TPR) repeat protein
MKCRICNARFHRIAMAACLVVLLGGCSKGAASQRHLERADRFFQEQQFSEAVIEYLNVLKADSSNRLAIARIGMAYFDLAAYQQAHPYLVKAAEQDPSNSDVRLRLARLYALGGDLEKARANAEAVMGQDPENLDALLTWVSAAGTPEAQDEALARMEEAKPRFAERAKYQIALGTLQFKRRAFAESEAAYRKAVELEAESADAHMALADFLMIKRESEEAGEHYRKAVDLSPVASVARVKWSGYLLQNGKADEAKKVLEEITAQDPDYAPALLGLAEFAFAERKYDATLDLVGQILKREPAHMQALLLRGRARVAKGDAARAVEEYDKLIQLYPGHAQLHYQLAAALGRSGNATRAIDELKKALQIQPDFLDAGFLMAEMQVRTGKPDDAIDYLEKLVQQRPDLGRAYVILGTAYRARGMADRALQAYRKLGELDPASPQAPYLQGVVLRSQGKGDDARAAFAKALEMKPDFTLALANLVSIDAAEKKYDAALARLDDEIKRRPDVPDLEYLRAKVLIAKGDRAEAEAALLKTIEMQPRMAAAYIDLGRLYASGGEKEKAVGKMDEVLKVSPNNIAALMMGGALYQELKEPEKAREYYERILTINPRFVPALNNLAYIYSEHLRDLDRAFEYAQQAREGAPDDAFVADTLGWIMYQRGDYKWGATLIQEAIDTLGHSGEVQYHLGLARLALGDEAAALAALQDAAAAEKPFEGQERARALAELLSIDPATADEATREKVEALASREPNLPAPKVKLAQIQWRAGNTDEAKKLLEQALRIRPDDVPALVYLAEYYEAVEDNPTKALELARKARAQMPADPRISGLLGWVAFKAGDHEWASGLLADAAVKLPEDAAMQYRAGMARYAVGRVDEAREMVKRALALSSTFAGSDDAQLFLDMADLTGQPDAAARVADVLQARPDFIPARVAAADMARTDRNLETARKQYEEVLKVYPEFSPAIKSLVEIYAAQKVGDDSAVRLARKARSLFPQDPSVAGAAGTIAFLNGDDRAASLLSEAVRATPDSPDLQQYLGLALIKKGDKSGARAALEKAVELNPELRDNDDVRGALEAAQK